MAKCSWTLDKWRDYFRTAKNSDIFDIMEHAVLVAAEDFPKEFKLRRERIAELLFTCKVTKCFGCEKVELQVPNNTNVAVNDNDEEKNKFKNESEAGGKGSKANSSIDHLVSNYSYDEAEALTEELEEERQKLEEVLRIKKVLDHTQHETAEVYECLRRLQLMGMTVEILKDTEIGRSVNALRRHSSKDIRNLSRILIEDWKLMVDEYADATAPCRGNESTPDSMKVSVVDQEEEGLPSPPLEDIAFLTTQATSIEFSHFFDGMDDDGNPRNSGEFNENQNIPVQKKQSTADWFDAPPKERKGEPQKKQEAVVKKQSTVLKPNKPSGGPGRPIKPKPTSEQKVNTNEKSDKGTIQKRPVPSQQIQPRRPDEDAVQVKLEATKRKLQERYQEAEKAKKQRTIQVMELHDLPKQGNQGHGLKNSHMKPGNNNNRHWGNGRR